MAIRIKRNTGLWGSGSKLNIRVNGETAAHVHEGRSVAVDLAENEATLSVTQLGVKSNPLRVKDGDVVQVTSTPWFRRNLWIYLLAVPAFALFTNFSLAAKAGILLAVGILNILSFRFINGFALTRVE